MPESVLENGKFRKTEQKEISPAKEPVTRHRKSKARDSLDHTSGHKARPRKLSHQNSFNGFTTSITSDFPPTPVDSTTFVIPSPKDVFLSAHNGLAAPVLTPPVSPAVSFGVGRNGHVQVSYSGLPDKEDTKVRQSCLYSSSSEGNPTSDDINRLVEQHFTNCGLGGFVHSTSRREPKEFPFQSCQVRRVFFYYRSFGNGHKTCEDTSQNVLCLLCMRLVPRFHSTRFSRSMLLSSNTREVVLFP